LYDAGGPLKKDTFDDGLVGHMVIKSTCFPFAERSIVADDGSKFAVGCSIIVGKDEKTVSYLLPVLLLL
jgi:hypothetical protein